jgi:spore germination protein KB
MELEKGRISNSQMILLILGFFWGITIIFSPGGQTGRDAWIVILLGMVEGIVFALTYIFLNQRFPGKTLVQIHEIVFGRYIGKFISLLLLWYFFHLNSLVISTFKEFILITSMPRTPDIIFSIFILLVCSYAVKSGIEVIARCSQILVPLIIGLFFIISTFLIKDFNLKNFQPILDIPVKDLLSAVHGVAIFPFAETVVFGMFIPFLQNKQTSPSTFIKGLILGGILLVLQAVKNTGLLGSASEIYFFQNFNADRLINLGFVTRVEILTVLAILTMGFVKITVLLYGTVLGGAQLLGCRSYRPLIIPVAVLLIILAQINFRNVTEINFTQQIYQIYALPFQVGIPLLTLVVALIRRLPKFRE